MTRGRRFESCHDTAWLFLRYFAGKLSWDITTTQVNSALHPSGVAKSSTSFGWGKGGKVTSAGWQVTLCDLVWHVISRSGVVISITNCYIRFTLLYFTSTTFFRFGDHDFSQERIFRRLMSIKHYTVGHILTARRSFPRFLILTTPLNSPTQLF